MFMKNPLDSLTVTFERSSRHERKCTFALVFFFFLGKGLFYLQSSVA